MHQVSERVIKISRVFTRGIGEISPALDIGLNIQHQRAHGREFSCPWSMMPSACANGTLAGIMVASWRANMQMSLGVIFLPPNRRPHFFLILSGLIPLRRRSALKSASFAASASPLTLLPF